MVAANDRGAITLIFWAKFGCPEEVPEGKVILLIDKNLAGHIRIYKPALRGPVFTIGRSPACEFRIGYDSYIKGSARDSLGNIQFRHFSNVHATFRCLDGTWFIYSGGLYPSETGGEWGNPKNGVYVNGHLLPGDNDPYPLFYRTDRFSKVQLGDAGKILVMRGIFGEQSTSIPQEFWDGEGWPDMAAILKFRKQQSEAQKKIKPDEKEEVKAEGINPAVPWYVSSVLVPGGGWFVAQPKWIQLPLIILASACLLAALWIWVNDN
jgi:hypothetical protein